GYLIRAAIPPPSHIHENFRRCRRFESRCKRKAAMDSRGGGCRLSSAKCNRLLQFREVVMFIKIWKSRRRLKRHSGEHIQTLEPRRLLSASVSLAAGGALTVNGTPGNDLIRITLDAVNPRQLDVIVNGATQSFTASSVSAITVNAGSGNDDVEVLELNGPINVPMTLLGGAGNDTLVGGSGNDYIDGGAGNDTIAGEAGTNILIGSSGTNRLVSEGTDTLYQNNAPSNVTPAAAQSTTPTPPAPTPTTPATAPAKKAKASAAPVSPAATPTAKGHKSKAKSTPPSKAKEHTAKQNNKGSQRQKRNHH